ncbi:MAG TPA: SET domain-containing protein [Bacteriovoracaceae bacterium]|nr:SET domain-containing protein [Bacteriovoracaceae bacterium]
MLHPHTELRFVSQEIGYGIFATQNIPIGTITWVKDQLDRVFTTEEIKALSVANNENLMKYTYRDRKGDYFFCWDLTRFVNHSYEPNSILTSMDFEIAIKDIRKGDEITNDYGTLNIIEPFRCANGPGHEREYVRPDDLLRFHKKWDSQINFAMDFENKVDQPLARFLTPEQKSRLEQIVGKNLELPSILENFYRG